MADDSSGSDESKAPEKFEVSTSSNSNDEEEDDLNVRVKGASHALAKKESIAAAQALTGGAAVLGKEDVDSGRLAKLKCPLCEKLQQRFHCRSCIKNGNIVHSRVAVLVGQRGENTLKEKQMSYFHLKSSLNVLSKRCENLLEKQKASEDMQFQIKQKTEQLKLLHDLIARKKVKLRSLNENCMELRKANAEKRKHLPNYPIKVRELENYVLDRIEKINKLREKHMELREKLKLRSRAGIMQLVEYIFPISEIVLKDEQTKRQNPEQRAMPPEDSETIAALAEAKNTSYIRGKWVFCGSGISEMQYRIVAPSLPANGDYSAYKDWLLENKDDVPKTTANEITPSKIRAYRIMGALTYTTQLTQLMSYYLNVRLPFKVSYGDFCKKLNEEQFTRKVSRLNNNIMYLAYTQEVQLRILKQKHTLENVLAILNLEKSNLGRQGFVDVSNAPMTKSEDSLLVGIVETATESESEDENSLRLDWESVPPCAPVLPQLQEPGANNNLMLGGGGPPTRQQQQYTTAESLMTSAANRITSFFSWHR